ncbi:MAG: thioredoxin family protein [Pseudomonadota bacterium]
MSNKHPLTKRRFVFGAALSALAALSIGTPQMAEARTVAFSEASYKRLLASGKPFMLGVHASWCSTCARQKRVINALKQTGNPYKGITIVEMDWDKYRGSALAKQLNIPRRSTLIMYNGGKEVDRIVAATGKSRIKRLIDAAY